MRVIDLDNVQEASEYASPPPGGYVCIITSVRDEPEKEYLIVEYDITEGEYTGYYAELEARRGFWGLRDIRSYKPQALPFFKGFITAVTASNPGYQFNYDEKSLLGKRIGLVLGEREYQKKDGSIGTRLDPELPRSVDAIYTGDFKIPEKKLLVPQTAPQTRTGYNSGNRQSSGYNGEYGGNTQSGGYSGYGGNFNDTDIDDPGLPWNR